MMMPDHNQTEMSMGGIKTNVRRGAIGLYGRWAVGRAGALLPERDNVLVWTW